MKAVLDLLCEQYYYQMLRYLCNNVLKAEVFVVGDIPYRNTYKTADGSSIWPTCHFHHWRRKVFFFQEYCDLKEFLWKPSWCWCHSWRNISTSNEQILPRKVTFVVETMPVVVNLSETSTVLSKVDLIRCCNGKLQIVAFAFTSNLFHCKEEWRFLKGRLKKLRTLFVYLPVHVLMA